MIVYLITNQMNGKRYVGQTSFDLQTRWKDHLHATAGKSNAIIHKAIRKYGVENFVIEEIAQAGSLEELDFLEIKWINWLESLAPNGYNQAEGGRNNRKGVKASEETKAKLRAAWVARKKRGDHRKSGEPMPWLTPYLFKTGRKLSLEERQILSATQRVGWDNPNSKAKAAAHLANQRATDLFKFTNRQRKEQTT